MELAPQSSRCPDLTLHGAPRCHRTTTCNRLGRAASGKGHAPPQSPEERVWLRVTYARCTGGRLLHRPMGAPAPVGALAGGDVERPSGLSRRFRCISRIPNGLYVFHVSLYVHVAYDRARG